MHHSSVAYASSRLKCRSVLHKTCLADSSDWGVGLSGLLCGSQVPGFDTPGSSCRIRHFQSGVMLWGFDTPGSICRLRHFQTGVTPPGLEFARFKLPNTPHSIRRGAPSLNTPSSPCRLRHIQSGVTLCGFDTPGSICRLRHFQSGVTLWGFDTPGSTRRHAPGLDKYCSAAVLLSGPICVVPSCETKPDEFWAKKQPAPPLSPGRTGRTR